jgi:hypothetical protein
MELNMTTPQQPELPALLPCPFCGAGEHQIRENGRMWSGMRFTEPASVTVHHWCEKPDGQPQSVVTITGRDEASAIGLWNARTQAAVLADRESRKVVAWRYMPSPTWGEYVITQDPKVAEVARSMGVDVEELTVGATSKVEDKT